MGRRDIDVNISEAKQFISDKLEKGMSLNQALRSYSQKCKLSVSTIRKYLLKHDEDFMNKIRSKSNKNVCKNNELNKLKIDSCQTNINLPRDMSIMPGQGQTWIPPYGDTSFLSANKESSILEDMDNAQVSFNGQLFRYEISNKGIEIVTALDIAISNKKLVVQDIEHLIKELEKVVKITNTLF